MVYDAEAPVSGERWRLLILREGTVRCDHLLVEGVVERNLWPIRNPGRSWAS
jgi:hypothetical protein